MDRVTIPTTIVSGALGTGKTTAILGAFASRPEGERWAVLVNEFGSVGIDGPILSSGGVEVREIAGGCVCCTANLPLRVGLVKLVREVRPDRLFIEPTGLAHPASVIDAVRSEGLRGSLSLRATITLVDPRRYGARREDPLYLDQILAADVLLGNFADVTPEDVAKRFLEEASARYPPPLVVAMTTHGKIDPHWLDLEPAPRSGYRILHPEQASPSEVGLTWSPETIFPIDALQERVQSLVRRPGLLRLKGVFRTPRGWLLVNATPDTVSFSPIGWRRDSRVSLIAEPAPSAEELNHWFVGGNA